MTRILLDPATPTPQARVPMRYVWDLVEYLASHRTRVAYTYAPDHIRVDFLHMTHSAAQHLLDDWSTTHLPTPVPVQSP